MNGSTTTLRILRRCLNTWAIAAIAGCSGTNNGNASNNSGGSISLGGGTGLGNAGAPGDATGSTNVSGGGNAFGGASSSDPYTCIQTTPQGKCFYSSDAYITGASGDPYLNQNIWAGSTTYKQVLYGASPEDWYVVANANTNFGGVLTFPNVGFNMSGAVDGKLSLTSSFSTSFTHDTKTAAWAAYDLWFNDWADEVMIQTDIAAPSAYNCTAVAAATFAGMPWHMCRFDAERVWKPGSDDDHLINQSSGTIDIQAMLEWMEQNGQLPAGSTWTASSFGFEVCDTGGVDVKFWVNGFTWTAK